MQFQVLLWLINVALNWIYVSQTTVSSKRVDSAENEHVFGKEQFALPLPSWESVPIF